MLIWMMAACAPGQWAAELWGEEYAVDGIPAAEFEDGCSAAFTTFEAGVTEAALLDAGGDAVASLGADRFELTQGPPLSMGEAEVPMGNYDTARFALGPQDGPSLAVVGTLSCGEDTVALDWTFETERTYLCALDGLDVGQGGLTQLTIHADHLFYDALEDPEAGLRGQAIVDADSDGDGAVSAEELSAVDLPTLGYSVGQQSEVLDLWAFLQAQTRSVGHVDGEGHCEVDS